MCSADCDVMDLFACRRYEIVNVARVLWRGIGTSMRH